MKPIVKTLFVGTVVAATMGISAAAQAAPGYCNTSFGGATIQTDGLAVGDATFQIGAATYTADDCYGIVNTGASDVATNLTYLNNLAWVAFAGGVKDDFGGGSAGPTTIGGLQYTLQTTTLSGGGTTSSTQAWTLAWSDPNGAAAPNLPALVDFVIQWNGGNKDVFYLFDDVLLTVSPTNGSGVIDIKVMNPPGNADIGTSHLTAYFTNATSVCTAAQCGDVNVPEPASLALMGLAAAAFGLARRRRPV